MSNPTNFFYFSLVMKYFKFNEDTSLENDPSLGNMVNA